MTEGLRSWREVKILLKRRFEVLVDEDLEREGDDKEKLFRRLEEKLGKTKQELQQIFAEIQLS
jgi:hypothetical protein